jgi:hypothetical protein
MDSHLDWIKKWEQVMKAVHTLDSSNNNDSDSDETNILFSLQYLSNEAQRMGYSQLCNILQAALKLASDRELIAEDISALSGDHSEDSKAIYEFLMLFARALPDTKNEVLSVMELMEINEADLQDNYDA